MKQEIMGFVPAAATKPDVSVSSLSNKEEAKQKKRTKKEKPKPSLERWHGKNGDLFEVDRRFTLILSGLITGGTLARLGPGCIATWLVMRTHTRWTTGLVSMGMEAIADQSGQSERSVKNQIKALADEGLIEIVKLEQGKRGLYKMMDPLPVFIPDEEDPEKRVQAGCIPIPFDPHNAGKTLSKLEQFERTGVIPPELEAEGITFQMNLNLTVIKNEAGGNVVINYHGDTAAAAAFGSADTDGRKVWNNWRRRQEQIQSDYNAVLALPEGPGKLAAIRVIRAELDKLEQELQMDASLDEADAIDVV